MARLGPLTRRPGVECHTRERDALRINAVLASPGPTVEAQRGELSPSFDQLTGDTETFGFAAGLQQPGASSVVSGGPEHTNIAAHLQVLARGLAGLAGA